MLLHTVSLVMVETEDRVHAVLVHKGARDPREGLYLATLNKELAVLAPTMLLAFRALALEAAKAALQEAGFDGALSFAENPDGTLERIL